MRTGRSRSGCWQHRRLAHRRIHNATNILILSASAELWNRATTRDFKIGSYQLDQYKSVPKIRDVEGFLWRIRKMKRPPTATSRLARVQDRKLRMKHRGIEFDVEEVSPSKWRWKIHESETLGSALASEPEYPIVHRQLSTASTRSTARLVQ